MAHAQQRQPGNGVAYFLTYKRVKNINLRIGPDGEAHASAPSACLRRRWTLLFFQRRPGWSGQRHGLRAAVQRTALPAR